MRGIPDSDKEAISRWDKAVAASKKKGGKIKGLVDKYLKKGKDKVNVDFEFLLNNIAQAKSTSDLNKLGDTTSKMKFTSLELKDLKRAVDLKRKALK